MVYLAILVATYVLGISFRLCNELLLFMCSTVFSHADASRVRAMVLRILCVNRELPSLFLDAHGMRTYAGRQATPSSSLLHACDVTPINHNRAEDRAVRIRTSIDKDTVRPSPHKRCYSSTENVLTEIEIGLH